MSSPFCGLAGARFDRLDPLRQMLLIGQEGRACRRGDDLAMSARDRRQLQILAEVGFEHDVRDQPNIAMRSATLMNSQKRVTGL